MYYDKYGPGSVQKIDFGYGRTNPKVWGYKQPEKKKKSDKTYLQEMSQWVINNKKWEAAKKFADRHKWEFKILTEKALNL